MQASTFATPPTAPGSIALILFPYGDDADGNTVPEAGSFDYKFVVELL